MKNELYQQIGDRISRRRRFLSVTQQELADASGCKRTSIANIESGNHCVPLEKLYAICEHLEVSINSILPERGTVLATESMTIDGQNYKLTPKLARAIKTAARVGDCYDNPADCVKIGGIPLGDI